MKSHSIYQQRNLQPCLRRQENNTSNTVAGYGVGSSPTRDEEEPHQKQDVKQHLEQGVVVKKHHHLGHHQSKMAQQHIAHVLGDHLSKVKERWKINHLWNKMKAPSGNKEEEEGNHLQSISNKRMLIHDTTMEPSSEEDEETMEIHHESIHAKHKEGISSSSSTIINNRISATREPPCTPSRNGEEDVGSWRTRAMVKGIHEKDLMQRYHQQCI